MKMSHWCWYQCKWHQSLPPLLTNGCRPVGKSSNDEGGICGDFSPGDSLFTASTGRAKKQVFWCKGYRETIFKCVDRCIGLLERIIVAKDWWRMLLGIPVSLFCFPVWRRGGRRGGKVRGVSSRARDESIGDAHDARETPRASRRLTLKCKPWSESTVAKILCMCVHACFL